MTTGDGERDSCESDPPGENGGPTLDRRRYLVAAATPTIAALAGCPGEVSRTFSATPVILPQSVLARREYSESSVESITSERSGSVAGVEFEATIESHLSVYHPERETDLSNGDDLYPGVGAFSTPDASVRGNSVNPLVSDSLQSILAGEALPEVRTQILARLSELDGPEVSWVRGPARIDVGTALDLGASGLSGELLGESVNIETFGGVAEDRDSLSAVLVFLTRSVGDDAVIVAGVLDRQLDDGETTDRSIVDAEGGYFRPDQLAGGLSVFVDLLNLFQIQGPGTPTPTPTATPTPTPSSTGSSGSGTVIDDFEDGNTSEYRPLGIANSSFPTSPTKNGSKALKFTNMYSSYGIASSGGLPNYPHQGDQFRASFRFESTPPAGRSFELQFGTDANGNHHFASVTKRSGSDWDVGLFGNGSPGSSSFTVSLSAGNWYVLDIAWGPADIELSVLDDTGTQLGSTTVPSTGDNGDDYIAFKAYPEQKAFLWDYAHIVGGARSGYPLVIDDFEDGKPNEYRQLGIVNSTFPNSPVKHGSRSLQFTNMYSSYGFESTGGLPNYPHQGDRFRAWFRFEQTPNTAQTVSMQFGKDAQGRRYSVWASKLQSGTQWELSLSGYGSSGNSTFTASLSTATWYAFDVAWGPQTIELTLVDANGTSLGTATVPNTGDSGDDLVAFQATPEANTYLWDYAHIVGSAR